MPCGHCLLFCACFAVGAVVLARKAYSLVTYLIGMFSAKSTLSQYHAGPGKKTWAVVTGGSGGIGLAYAKELARRNFSVLLIALDDPSLSDSVKEVQAVNPKVDVEALAADFSKPEVYDSIGARLQKLEDIGVLVNNVGVTLDPPGRFHQVPLSAVQRVLSVNVAAMTLVTHAVVPRMVNRECGKKGLVISMSSFVARVPVPLLQVYSASKRYVEHLSDALASEYQGRVNFITVAPWWVATAMTKIRRTSWRVVSAESVAAGVMRSADASHSALDPYWVFALFDFLVENLPLFMVQAGITRFLSMVRSLYLKRQQKKAAESTTKSQ